MASNLHINLNNKRISLTHLNKATKNLLSSAEQAQSINKKLIQKIIHPDYILFDWEYFSRELEFE